MAQNPQKLKKVEIAHVAESAEFREKITEHLRQVIEGAAFRGSHRSAQFLRYIVEQAIAKRFELLKERMIGVELFGRSPSYDTGEDAIVRVTASDVRRRLLQHYGKYGSDAAFHLVLPSGSYVPEIEFDLPAEANEYECEETPGLSLAPFDATASEETQAVGPVEGRKRWRRILALSATLNVALLGLVVGLLLWNHFAHGGARSKSVLPWSAFFRSARRTVLIPSDPNLAEVQMLEGTVVSVSEYAKHNYFIHNGLPLNQLPDNERFGHRFLRGDKAAVVDLPIAVSIARMAEYNRRAIEVRGPRALQFPDLKTADNFIFLGSPQSNPWTSLFADQLDFSFGYDAVAHTEYIRNARPRSGELARYDATAENSYAILAFVQNPDQDGQVLLLGGLTSEATESAGWLATDLPRLAEVLQNCGVRSTQHFELLLHLNWVAGYPNHIQVVACHVLTSIPGHLQEEK
jgi:hypothetical protein